MLKLSQIKPVNQMLLIEKIKEDEGPQDKVIKGAGGANITLSVFAKAGNYMRVKVVAVSDRTPEYPMIYKPGEIVIIPRMGIKADYTLDGKEYTFVSMHSVVGIERAEQSFSERMAMSASRNLNGSIVN